MASRRLAREDPPELRIARSKGSYVFDTHGRKYVDFPMVWCVGNPAWVSRARLAAFGPTRSGSTASGACSGITNMGLPILASRMVLPANRCRFAEPCAGPRPARQPGARNTLRHFT